MQCVNTWKWIGATILLLAAACQSASMATPTSSPEAPTPVRHTLTPTALPEPPATAAATATARESEPAPTHTATPVAFQVCSPLAEETIPELWEILSDPYNPPPPGRDERHQGVDFSYWRRGERSTIEGEGIQSILPGVVAAAIIDRLPYGNMVMIETPADMLPLEIIDALGMEAGESLYHLYAHMQNPPQVSLGEAVVCGQALGMVGMSGYNVVNPHLHLETRLGPAGAVFESMAFYDTGATIQEMDTYRLWRTSGTFRHFDPMTLFTLTIEEDFVILKLPNVR